MLQYNWASVPAEEMNPHITRRAIHTGNMTIARLTLKKGGVVPVHHHINEQVSFVISGALKFTIGGEVKELRAGECLVIPPDVPHGVEVLEDTDVIDTFAPKRMDWITGDDAYLRK
ncbi:MAG: cupin domain-containing protein [Acidobacteria bacterium]|nr:cupin domain-containing protein [Acidobacteriota bacterium]